MEPGFHQFSFLLIADPDNLSTDQEFRFTQQQSIRENRYDLWVDSPVDAESVPHWPNIDDGFAVGSRFVWADFVDPKTGSPLTALQARAGERICLSIRIYNPDPAQAGPSADIPVWVGVSLNDTWAFASEEVLLGSAPAGQVFTTSVVAPAVSGTYQLMGVVISSPHYAQFTAPGDRVGIAASAATMRIQLTVTP